MTVVKLCTHIKLSLFKLPNIMFKESPMASSEMFRSLMVWSILLLTIMFLLHTVTVGNYKHTGSNHVKVEKKIWLSECPVNVQAYAHTCARTYAHTYAHTYVHPYAHTCPHMCSNAHACMWVCVYICPYVHPCACMIANWQKIHKSRKYEYMHTTFSSQISNIIGQWQIIMCTH